MMQNDRIALLGDTHGHLDERVAGVAAGCDAVVHTGDVGGASILAALGWSQGTVGAVSGNNDTHRHWGADGPALIDELPEALQWPLPGGLLVVVHGHRVRARDRHRRLRALYPDAGAILYGHSHRLNIDTDTQPWVLNPGAAGRSRTYGGPSCLVLEARAQTWSITPHRFASKRRRR
jgi:putative phosphoesterase